MSETARDDIEQLVNKNVVFWMRKGATRHVAVFGKLEYEPRIDTYYVRMKVTKKLAPVCPGLVDIDVERRVITEK